MPPTTVSLAWRFARHSLSVVHPFEVQANVTNRCNFNCRFCECPDIHQTEMNTAQWFEVIHGLRRLGGIRFKFQGGEPSLRADFGELAAEAQRVGLVTAITTNGSIFAARPELLEHLDEVMFSLDSPRPETNDYLRKPGSHALVLAAIREATARGKKVSLNMTVSRRNLAHVEEMLDLCESLGVLFHAQWLGNFWAYATRDSGPDALTDQEIRDLHRQMAAWKREGRLVLFAEESYLYTSRWSDFSAPMRRGPDATDCVAGRSYFHIEPNGDVYPCGFLVGQMAARNALIDGLAPALAHARRHHCQDCAMTYLNERKFLFKLKPFAVRALLARNRAWPHARG
ncbi:MAG: radical SAM protein [Deltaproteobacteria bacterium]|nr:radical SAM protein [Deltaproteobacteria bacterium]